MEKEETNKRELHSKTMDSGRWSGENAGQVSIDEFYDGIMAMFNDCPPLMGMPKERVPWILSRFWTYLEDKGLTFEFMAYVSESNRRKIEGASRRKYRGVCAQTLTDVVPFPGGNP